MWPLTIRMIRTFSSHESNYSNELYNAGSYDLYELYESTKTFTHRQVSLIASRI